MTTLDKLAQIPDLAALAYVSRDTPHRPEGGRRRARTGSPMPAEVACLDMLRPDEHGLLAVLSEAVRVVVEEMRAASVYEPTPDAEPTWAGECGYLIAQCSWWQSDPFCREWIAGDGTREKPGAVNRVHGELARWIGQPPAQRLACPICRGRLNRDSYGATGDGQQLACSECGHIWHSKDIAHEAVKRTPMSLPDIATMLDLTERTLQRWASAGILQPVTDHEPSPKAPALYLPEDATRAANMIRAG